MEDGVEVNGVDRAGNPPVEEETYNQEEEKEETELDRICQDVREKRLNTIKIYGDSFDSPSPEDCLKKREHVYKLADAIKSNQSFECLHLESTGLTIEGLEILVGATRDHPSLSRFHVMGEFLGDEGAVILAKGLPRSLSEFTASDCDIKEHGGKELLKALRDHNLEKLSLSDNEFGDGFIEDFECPQSLKFLDLYNCCITDVGAQKLAIALVIKSANVCELLLGGNDIGDVGAATLGGILAKVPIEHLSVRRNPVGDAGARALGCALCDPDCKLTYLDVRYCAIGDEGIEGIATGLYKNMSLQGMDIGHNPYGKRGWRALRDALFDSNRTLIRIEGSAEDEYGEAFDQLLFLLYLNKAGLREPLVNPKQRELFESLSKALDGQHKNCALLVKMMKGSGREDETD